MKYSFEGFEEVPTFKKFRAANENFFILVENQIIGAIGIIQLIGIFEF